MIRNLNQVNFQGFGTVPPERNQRDQKFDAPAGEWQLSQERAELFRSDSDVWIAPGTGMSVLSVSRDGENFQHFYLDKLVSVWTSW